MDSVRFGRALGIGARAAAKTLVTAVDAATSPNPSAEAKARPAAASDASAGAAPSAGADDSGGTRAASSASRKVEAPGGRLGQRAVETADRVRQTGRGLKEGGRRFGEAAWGPVVKLSGVLWLELTGVFFGIFAVFAGTSAWKVREALQETAGNRDAHVHLLLSAAMAAVFGYFCVSSFVKASRRGRRR